MRPELIVFNYVAWTGLVWLGAALVTSIGASPRLKQAVWRGAAGLLLFPLLIFPFVTAKQRHLHANAPLPELDPILVGPGTEVINMIAKEAIVRLPDIGGMLLTILAAGWGYRAGLAMWRQIKLQHLKRNATRSDLSAADWSKTLRLKRVPEIQLIPTGSPFVAGIRRPVIYLPKQVASLHGVSQVIAHECVHLKRGDLLTRPIERLVTDIFWFSPFVWLVRGELDYLREAVVDSETSALTGDRLAYAKALTAVARFARPVPKLPVAAFILPKEENLKMRITDLLTHGPRRPLATLTASLALIVCMTPVAVTQTQSAKAPAMVVFSHPVLMAGRVTSPYGARPDPTTKKPVWHNGIDLAAAEGEPVYAPVGGTVTYSGYIKGYGNIVELSSTDGRRLRFAQLKTLGVSVGETVSSGDTIATVGQSGRATGPHLHLEVWEPYTNNNGELSSRPIDPPSVSGLVLIDGVEIESRDEVMPPADDSEPEKKAACGVGSFEISYPDDWAPATSANGSVGDLKVAAHPSPTYPAAAVATNTSGACDILIDVSKDGSVTVQNAVCSDDVFLASAKASMKTAKFEPTSDGAKGYVYPLLYCIE